MGVKVKKVKDEFPKVERAIKELDGKKVIVGCLEGEHQWLAAIHEYGCRITVTPKMRAYLHHKGLHLKASTTEIIIPERSFLRTGHDENIKEVLDIADALIEDVVAGTMDADMFLDAVGREMASRIKDFARDLKEPANHPYTVQEKGSANPLWDTGQMIGGIVHKIEE